MVVGTTYNGGKETPFQLEEGDDTNLLIGVKKSAFTILRSSFQCENDTTVHEFWIRNCIGYYVPPEWAYYPAWGIWSLGNHVYSGINGSFYPNRPSDRPKKVVFDSNRTSLADCISAGSSLWIIGGMAHNWTYAGSSKEGVFGSHEDGNFDLYGYLFRYYSEEEYYDYDYETEEDVYVQYNVTTSSHMCFLDRQLSDSELQRLAPAPNNDNVFERVFGGKIAEVRNWEIISNNTPILNTYYVAIENKKGDLLDVFTTTTFGVTVGSIVGEYADRMKEADRNRRVVDDLVIRI